MYRLAFLLQFLFLIGGIAYAKGTTVPTGVSIIISISFVVMAIIQAKLDKNSYTKITVLATFIYLFGNLVLANVLPFGFMAGMGVYFVAQAVNIYCFAKTSKELNKPVVNKGFIAGTIVYSTVVVIAWWIFFEPTKNSELLIFIALVYGIWLAAMAATGASLFCNNKVYIFTAIGSFFFLVSDFIAGAADIAGKDIPYKVNIVWTTYVIAIGGIIYGKNLLAGTKYKS
ncbi:MAG TPA: lysoplasmalogenase family protein [Pseudobacteroides sp.]|uniref:lysoplasmalogenase family protein n=1 Tax=Pseudobacteroides sp. TaxID=1968840 RepID=UPI002F93B737